MKHETYNVNRISVDLRNYTATDVKARQMVKNFPALIKKHKPNFDKKILVEILLVGKRKMQDLNFKHRKINKPTDVLSFPIQSSLLINGRQLLLGTIIICPPYVVQFNKDMAELTEHGLLHLLGENHQ